MKRIHTPADDPVRARGGAIRASYSSTKEGGNH